ncbi:glycosyl hydrolase 115 family protein [uncultured Chitinophaga sp.]|uniref:glycosyl hydrolase 115 family protein n=1 Tax=uncultured Chitinophaga sp. TaxID=339340 RepID=UPI0025FE9632|nr:glycosyl hydrolase 115 family protein [uncultured Chitinophaga sp.]
MHYFRFTLLLLLAVSANAQEKPLTVGYKSAAGTFSLVVPGKTTSIIYDSLDAEVTGIAATALKADLELLTGTEAIIMHHPHPNHIPIIIGTLGQSELITGLAKAGKINTAEVAGKWETFSLSIVNQPVKGVSKALVIFGSDPRGTAFGVFELSRLIGVSPLNWWADVIPGKRDAIYLSGTKSLVGPPSVQYRGIFINDEDWGLQPWAAKHMDTDVKDIGPRTYEKVFELMLRLKANYIWPAMHPCTKAFWYYPENPVLARKYQIVLGATHCEPLLRNNVDEWDHNFEKEYGKKPGEWRYDKNKEEIDRYWNDRVLQSVNNPAVYTVGMRGIHDGSMPGPPDKEAKKTLLEQVIVNQRSMLSKGLNKPAPEVPQIFCPYKEVLDLYRLGMQLPEDITIAWADDNYGYVRQLSNPQEQTRSGGSGVYYHFSYWGKPEDYLWLSTISPMLTSYELTKAYEQNARRLWVFNVGDIKPLEAELQFAMDFAWDVKAWSPEKAHKYSEHWAAETFGTAFAKSIGDIKREYYRLAAAGKPEHMGRLYFNLPDTNERIAAYVALTAKAKAVGKTIPARLQDAYFQLIQYPVEASMAMNQKILWARQSLHMAEGGDSAALSYAAKAQQAYAHIRQLTHQYNKETANGKWDGIMDDAPRKLKVFDMPPVATAIRAKGVADSAMVVATITAAAKFTAKAQNVKVIEGLGIGKSALTVWPMLIKTFTAADIHTAPYVDYKINVKIGERKIRVRCLPDFPLYTGMKLRYAISIDGGMPEFVNIATQAETGPWSENVMKGYVQGETVINNKVAGEKKVRVYFADPGVVVNEIVVE